MSLTDLISVLAFFVPLFSSFHMEKNWTAASVGIWLAAAFTLGVAGFAGSRAFSTRLHRFEATRMESPFWRRVVAILSIAQLGGIYALGVLSDAIVKALLQRFS